MLQISLKINRSAFLVSLILLSLASVGSCLAQDSLITDLTKKNLTTFVRKENSFTGPGWEKIISKGKSSNDILIGEDHFTNEIPFFTSAIASQFKFDNFFCEIDPYTATILQEKISKLSAPDLHTYVNTYGNTLSFYSYQSEFDLLKQFTRSNTTIRGTDQILLIGDRVIFTELSKSTKNTAAKKIYELIATNSKTYFDIFLKDQSKPFYLLTDDFEKNMNALLALKLTEREVKIVEAMKLSAKIYKSQSHELRIQLMKHQLMEVYSNWAGKRNLFKYGANHLAKGESFLEIYDTGNLVSSLNDAQYQQSLHIMILGISGTQASRFEGFPAEQIQPSDSMFKTLKPIIKNVNGEEWHCFDLLPLKDALNDGKLTVKDVKLQRIIKGYDLLVLIPKVTASKFAKTK
ncbi:MAG: hypothetical protein EOO88_29490 [Pedobacter sp.]|nr:MAG: hypothetical protein EOO88_29490 [Pedobacter sp.]